MSHELGTCDHCQMVTLRKELKKWFEFSLCAKCHQEQESGVEQTPPDKKTRIWYDY